MAMYVESRDATSQQKHMHNAHGMIRLPYSNMVHLTSYSSLTIYCRTFHTSNTNVRDICDMFFLFLPF